jgi:hypothetical protein
MVQDMENPPDNPRTVLVMSLWAESLPDGQLAWRGTIRAVDGRRRSFSTLQDLNRLLVELSGWQDAPCGSEDDPPHAVHE